MAPLKPPASLFDLAIASIGNTITSYIYEGMKSGEPKVFTKKLLIL